MPDTTGDIYCQQSLDDQCERTSLSQIRQRIQSGDIQSVVVTTVDRLSQNHEHLITLMAELGQHNVTLFTTKVKLENAE